VGITIAEFIVGGAVGICLGLFAWVFKFISHKTVRIAVKFLYGLIMSILIVVASELSKHPDSKYTAGLLMGYTSFRVWGADKPTKELKEFWYYFQPLFFGSVGSVLIFS
jgi:Kef-type K+ transport system membrane component KefB